MIDQDAFERISRSIPIHKRADEALVREFRSHAFLALIPTGQDVFLAGDRVDAILSGQFFPAIATVEQAAEAVMIPSEVVKDWVARHEIWRNFFLDLVSQRLASIMALVDEVAFQRMDRRISAFLLDRMDRSGEVVVTHQELDDELGSSREVISRITEDLAARGLIETSRVGVKVIAPERLGRQIEL